MFCEFSSLQVLHQLLRQLAIPTEPNGGNHTPQFTKSAGTKEAHEATLKVTKALAHTGFRVIADDSFFKEVRS
jgi:hypothetical protein